MNLLIQGRILMAFPMIKITYLIRLTVTGITENAWLVKRLLDSDSGAAKILGMTF